MKAKENVISTINNCSAVSEKQFQVQKEVSFEIMKELSIRKKLCVFELKKKDNLIAEANHQNIISEKERGYRKTYLKYENLS